MKNIVVLYGGQSTEHEVAVRSAQAILNNLNREKYAAHAVYIDKTGRFLQLGQIDDNIADAKSLMMMSSISKAESIASFCNYIATLDDPIIIPAIHGQTGEDGVIQGFLEVLGVKYAGSRVMGSALCMDKGYTNQVLHESGIPKSKFYILTKYDYDHADFETLSSDIEANCGFPCFVKPANNGSSVGVNRANAETLKRYIEEAFEYDTRIVIEEEIKGVELEVSILGNENPKPSLPGSYTSSREVFDYTAKYEDTTTVENVPHKLSDEKTKELQDLARRTYRVLSCEGLARVDIFMDEDEKFFVNEINTFPGMTTISLAPKLWVALTDMTFSDYLDEIIHYAEASTESRKSIRTTWGQE